MTHFELSDLTFRIGVNLGLGILKKGGRPNARLRRLRWNALIQRMTEESSDAWGCVDNEAVIVRLTGQQTNHATRKLFTLSSSMLALNRICEVSEPSIRCIFQLQ